MILIEINQHISDTLHIVYNFACHAGVPVDRADLYASLPLPEDVKTATHSMTDLGTFLMDTCVYVCERSPFLCVRVALLDGGFMVEFQPELPEEDPQPKSTYREF